MATEAERQAVIAEATRRNPSNPQLALWEYATQGGMSPDQIDEYMGWPKDTASTWAQQNNLLPKAQTYTQQQQAVIDEASKRATANKTTPQMELWKYATDGGMTPSQIDQYMGWQEGTSDTWAKQNVPNYQSNSRNYNDQQRSVIAEAERRAASNNTTAQQELWNYGVGGGMTPSQIDNFFGWEQGTSQRWYDGQQNLNGVRTAATSPNTFQGSSVVGGLFSDTFKKAGVTPNATNAAAAWNTVSPFGLVGQMNQDWAKDVKINMGNSTQTAPTSVNPATGTATSADPATRGGNSGGTAGQAPSSSMWGLMDAADYMESLSPTVAAWMREQAAAAISKSSADAQAKGGTATTLGAAGNVPANSMAADPATVAAARAAEAAAAARAAEAAAAATRGGGYTGGGGYSVGTGGYGKPGESGGGYATGG